MRGYARLVVRHKWLVGGITAAAVVLTLGLSKLETPVYASSAQLLLGSQLSSLSLLSGGAAAVQAPDVPTDIQLFSSQAVEAAAAAELRTPGAPAVSVGQVGATNVVAITAQSTNPAMAAKIANAYVSAYLHVERSQAIAEVLGVSTQVQSRITALQAQLGTVTAQEATATPAALPGLQATAASLTTQITADQSQLQQLQLTASLATGGGQVVASATPSSVPVAPDLKRNGMLALVIGFLLAVGVARLLALRDDTVRTRDDLVELVPQTPTLGVIPSVADWRKRQEARLVSHAAPSSAPAEAYRSVRTAVAFAGLERRFQVLQVTSAVLGEGKSTTAANLAVAFAQTGQSVLAVDCDLRRPRLAEFFGLGHEVGFTSVLLGQASLEEACVRVPWAPGLLVLPAGPVPPNPSELLGNARTAEVFTVLRGLAEVLVVDSSPLLPVTDAAVLSKQADAVVVVVAAGRSTRRQLLRALENLEQVGSGASGLVLNDVAHPESSSYGTYYYPAKAANGKATNGKVPRSHAEPRAPRARQETPNP